ncbi:hypothetical protein diail_9273 [Diaporthe ilicicola]|nr:hypothetical protein diail_9273 [Diaporthe ilicicola]
MSHNLLRLREEIDRANKNYGFCPNRIWQVDSQIRDRQGHLTTLFQGFSGVLSRSLKEAMAHEDHSACTFDYCEFSSRNFTAVQQYHEPVPSEEDYGENIKSRHMDKSICSTLSGLFREDTLSRAVNDGLLTAWKFDGRTLIEHPRPFMAISHVWSDGTGSGPWGPGHVNECLYVYFKRLAERFQCEGMWWDTLCIPQDKVARGKALNVMHLNYEYARVTLVHDRFLRKIPFTEPQTACLAIVLSSWFTRGWTALELAKSRKVKIIFKNAIKDLDEDILRKAGDNPAAAVIANLRSAEMSGVEDLIRTLGPRFTSWPSDRAVIAGLLTGVNTLASDNGETYQRDIFQRILLKIGTISHGHLFHTSATMSDGFSWFPTNLFQLPQSSTYPELAINDSGEVIGKWKVVSPRYVQLQDCIWDFSHPLIEARVRHVLAESRDKHVLLVVPSEGNATETDVKRALVVGVFRSGLGLPAFKCQFVGSLRFHTALNYAGQSKDMAVIVGDIRGWQRLGEHEIAWDIITQHQNAPDDYTRSRQDDRPHVSLEGGWTICHHAAWVGDWSLAKVENGPLPVDQPDMLGRCPIHLAAERGHHRIVATLLETGIDPSCPDGTGQTPLHRAAWAGSLRTVECLLEKGSRATARDMFGNSALHLAADMGFEDVVCRLCENVHVMTLGRNGLTPLHYAAMSGHEAILEYLLRMGASIEAADRTFGWTALHCAADNGHAGTVRRLLAHKASVDTRDDRVRWTPLHFAEMNGNKEVSKLLRHNKASRNAEDIHGWTPLHFTDIRLNTERVMDGMSEVGWSLLHLIAIDGRRKVTRFMLDSEKGAGISEETIQAHILHKAAERGYYRAVEILVGRGAFVGEAIDNYKLPVPTTVDSSGKHSELVGSLTPLHLAARNGHSKTAWILVEIGADVNDEVDGELFALRFTALHLAAMSGCPRTVSSLTQQRANLNIQTVLGYTALHFAAMCGHKDVVEKLLDERASIYVKSGDELSALAYAVQEGHDAVVDMLLEKHPSLDKRSNALGALYKAVVKGRVDMFTKLFRLGAPLDATFNGQTLLHRASRNGQDEIVRILIEQHADVNATVPEDLEDDILDMRARIHGHRRATALHFAAEEGHEIVTEMLLAANASLDIRDFDGLNPLHIAAKGGRDKIVRKLLEKGAGVDKEAGNEKYLDRRTALHFAVQGAGSVQVMKFLRGNHDEAGGFVDPRYHETVEELLRHGADPNATDFLRQTALHYAASSGWEDLVTKLIEGGASADMKNKDGHTPRRLALEAGHDTIAKALSRHEKGLFRRLRA